MLAPNKQNLLYLQKFSKTLRNGHKLLKEKRSGLVKNFMDTCVEGKHMESEVSGGLKKILDNYSFTMSNVSHTELLEALDFLPISKLETNTVRITGVKLDRIKLDIQVPRRDKIHSEVEKCLEQFARYFPKILQLSQLKLNASSISKEIEKTNRQISNLERRMEQVKLDIKNITSVLEEQQNQSKAVLISIFG